MDIALYLKEKTEKIINKVIKYRPYAILEKRLNRILKISFI